MISLYVLLVVLQECHVVVVFGQTSQMQQDRGLKVAKLGHNVTLKCSCEEETLVYFTWYQQKLGGKPELISYRLRRNTDSEVQKEFKERFGSFGSTNYDSLRISNLQVTDSASYFCGGINFGAVEFGEGVYIHVQLPTHHQGTSSVVQDQTRKQLVRGDSLDLSCSVEAGTCQEENSFYWIRHGTSQPAIIYPADGDCKALGSRKCTAKLIVGDATTKDSGIYRCAVASCGQIIFGNGTTVEIANAVSTDLNISHPLVYWLCVALASTIIINFILAITVYKLKRKTSLSRQEVSRSLPPSVMHCTADMHQADIHYAALNINRNDELRNRDDTEDHACVYSSVRSRSSELA